PCGPLALSRERRGVSLASRASRAARCPAGGSTTGAATALFCGVTSIAVRGENAPPGNCPSFENRRPLPSSVTFASLQVKSPLARQYFVSSPLAWLLRHLAASPRRRARLGPEVSGAPAPSRVPSGPVEDPARWLQATSLSQRPIRGQHRRERFRTTNRAG